MSSAPALQPLPQRNVPLLIGGYFSLAFAVFQISAIWWPQPVLRYFGGPEQLSRQRPLAYALLCLGVGIAVAVFGVYALSAAGQLRRLPLLRTLVTTVTVIYLLRGLFAVPQIPSVLRHPEYLRVLVFSLIALTVGLVHLAGLVRLFRTYTRR
jgi:hypothetical protein